MTGRAEAERMSRGTETAVCLLRIERQAEGLLITMVVTRDVETGLQGPPLHFSDASGAAAAVAAFLDSVERDQASSRFQ